MVKKDNQENVDSQEFDNVAGWLKDGFELSSGPRGQMTSNRARAKNYTLVLYPDDLPEDWFDVFKGLGFRLVLSPIHDKDTNPDGEIKKRHYHLLMMGDRNWIKFDDLKELVLENFNGKGVAVPQKCSNVEGLVRYFIHKDNPEKFQYNQEDIEVYGKVDIDKYFQLTEADKRSLVSDILDFVDDEDITEGYKLIQYARKNNIEWFDYLSKNYYFVDKYITSRRHFIKEKKQEEELKYSKLDTKGDDFNEK